jgi:twitching motility protein PilJ
MQSVHDRLRGSDEADPLPPLPGKVAPQLSALENSWRGMSDDMDTVITGAETAARMRENGKGLDDLFSSARLTAQEMFGAMAAARASAEQVSLAGRQLVRLERMSIDVARALGGGTDSGAATQRLRRDVADFLGTNSRLLGGDASEPASKVSDPVAQQSITRLATLFANNAGVIESFVDESDSLIKLHGAARSLDAQSDPFLQASRALGGSYRRVSAARAEYTTAVIVFGLMALACLLMLGIQLIRDARARTEDLRRREQESRDRNRRNQDAILRLLDEMSELAEGNLTAYASVTEDITGAIADAFNYAIDALRHVVARINHTSERVAESSQVTRTRTIQLSVASDKQNAEIVKAAASIQNMAESVERVSANSAASSEVAQQSVAIANKGAQAVRETIDSLDDIRDTIRETGKRLKRLGESSQEIGNMVGLIDDIADQTNVLALNAAIQASMAGESGRGFAVVADEVQRLAERAGQATKRIEQLVKTIQSDASEAIDSMEKSTAGVVQGARLAQRAGTSLGEIETVSQQLAKLIETISTASREQAARATAVAKTMTAIREITSQTRAGANTTAKSVGNLVQLAEALKTSVAGFNLPESADPTVVDLHAGSGAGEDARGVVRREGKGKATDIRILRS